MLSKKIVSHCFCHIALCFLGAFKRPCELCANTIYLLVLFLTKNTYLSQGCTKENLGKSFNLMSYILEKGCFEKKLTNLRLLGECRKRNPETFRRNASIPVKARASAFFLPKKLRNDGYIIHFLILVGKSDLLYFIFFLCFLLP